jgi:hypothetical protein
MRNGVLISVAVFLTQFVFTSAKAVEIEKLVMPGPVVSGHADVEGQCSACHTAFEKENQNVKCIECHEDVGADIEQKKGFHGLFPEVQEQQCKTCHTEHIGRDGIIVILDEKTFDHEMTDFHLAGKHQEVECDGCHEEGKKYRDAPGDCIDCHREDDVHDGQLGEACNDCHTPADWKEVEFDHDTTDYPLIGKHREVLCLDCHHDQTFRVTPTTCFGCHEKDDAHDGRSGTKCGNCHNPTDWHDTSFNHDRDTDFPLDGKHAKLTCDDCHSDDPFADELESTCISCHLEDDNHEGHFGEKCETCHVTEDWPIIEFDHDTDTDYPIKGAHADVACIGCHIEPIYDVALESTCIACHLDDDVHKTEQGDQCQNCHNEIAWTDNVRFDHGLTRFPLLGKHMDAECEDCHETQEFKLAETECIACHAEDDHHEDRYGDDCGLCHNPVEWELWLFDHNTQTDYVLDGAHTVVACDDCHRQSLTAMKKVGSECGDCHKLDDVHDGEFGPDCGRCHSSTSFREVRSVQ